MSSCVYLVLSLAYELPEDGTDVPKHVGAGKDCMDVFVVSAFVCFFFLFSFNGKSPRDQPTR